jgi:hypothetical protein
VIPAEMDQREIRQRQLFYEFNLDDVVRPDHLLRGSTYSRRQCCRVYTNN